MVCQIIWSFCFSARYCIRGNRNAPPSNLDGWCTRVRLLDGVEEVLRRKPPHVGRTVHSDSLRSPRVPLTTALDLVEDNTGYDDQENTAESATERDKDDDTIGQVLA